MLENLRSGEPLTAMETQIHDELDEAVLDAYGWGDLKEAPHSCGASECAAIDKREALPNDVPFTPPQECSGSLLPPAGRKGFEQELLTRLVALNHERAAEEKRGLIRWLRPDYQNPTKASDANSDGHRPPLQADLAGIETSSLSKIQNQQSSIDNPASSYQWPDRLPDQVTIIRKLIAGYDKSVVTPDAESLSAHFGRKNKKRTEQIERILETLKGLGQL